MTQLHPGGCRATTFSRVFGHENIKRMIRERKPDYAAGAETSIATKNRHTGKPHLHAREIARRIRQGAC